MRVIGSARLQVEPRASGPDGVDGQGFRGEGCWRVTRVAVDAGSLTPGRCAEQLGAGHGGLRRLHGSEQVQGYEQPLGASTIADSWRAGGTPQDRHEELEHQRPPPARSASATPIQVEAVSPDSKYPGRYASLIA